MLSPLGLATRAYEMQNDILKFTEEGIEVKHINQVIKWVTVGDLDTTGGEQVEDLRIESRSGGQ